MEVIKYNPIHRDQLEKLLVEIFNEEMPYAVLRTKNLALAEEQGELEGEDDNVLGIGGTYAEAVDSVDEVAFDAGCTQAYIELDSSERSTDALMMWPPAEKSNVFERYRLASFS